LHKKANSQQPSAVSCKLKAEGSERTCIVTREALAKEDLLRFVVSPQGTLVFDVDGKLPGRGMYVKLSRLLLAEALAKRLFSKAAGEQVNLPEGFQKTVEALLRQRVVEALSFARKSGLVITGFEKVEEALSKGQVAALLHATDAGEDGVKKLKHADVPTYQFLARDVLSHVLSKENAVHVALLKGQGSAFFLSQARRFTLFLE
jgi:hypothetical protein